MGKLSSCLLPLPCFVLFYLLKPNEAIRVRLVQASQRLVFCYIALILGFYLWYSGAISETLEPCVEVPGIKPELMTRSASTITPVLSSHHPPRRLLLTSAVSRTIYKSEESIPEFLGKEGWLGPFPSSFPQQNPAPI